MRIQHLGKIVEAHHMTEKDTILNLLTISKDIYLNLPVIWIGTLQSLQTMIRMIIFQIWGLDRCVLLIMIDRYVPLKVDQI